MLPLILKWFICVAAVTAVLQFAQMPLRRRGHALAYLLLFVIKAAAAAYIAFECMAYPNRIFWNLGYLPGAMYAALLCDSAADLIAFVMRMTCKKAPRVRTVTLIGIMLTVVFFVYGTVNMQTIIPNEHVYASDKLKETHSFVFLADLHYGSAQSEGVVDKALSEIAALQPDFVLLGGDITDEHTTAEEMRSIYEKLGSLGAPVYYIYGNHDRQDHGDYLGGVKYTPEELEEAISDSGITILQDDIAVIADDLVILGREDYSAGDARCAVSELPDIPDDAYVVCADHSPYQDDDITATGADLQLSGHTHAGQFFPMQYLYRLGVDNVYGDYRRGNTDLYVSSGITGWYFPFRTAAHCNYEIITLMPD